MNKYPYNNKNSFMQLRLNSWKVKLVRSTFGIDYYELPKSLCSFFWLFVLSVVLLPFVLYGHLLNVKFLFGKNHNPLSNAVACGMMTFFGIGVLGHEMTSAGFLKFSHIIDFSYFDSWSKSLSLIPALYYYSLIGLIIIVPIGYLLYLLIVYLSDKYDQRQDRIKNDIKKRKIFKENKNSLTIEYIKAIKNKVCPLINYIEDEKK
jgi:hypothetical protein